MLFLIRIMLSYDVHLTSNTQYVGVFASYPSSKAHAFELACLALSLMKDETTQLQISSIVSLVCNWHFKKSFENVTDVIGGQLCN